MLRRVYLLALAAVLALQPASAMHIMEGFLPLRWCLLWLLISLPFVLLSYRYVARQIKATPRMRSTFALSAAFVFILSALKMPSVAGSRSHLTGATFGTLGVGPMALPLVGTIVLLFQALLLAHGGISTLGANIFSLSIAGPFVAYALYRGLGRLGLGQRLTIFVATFCGSMATYIATSFQLALAYPDPVGGILGAAWKFLGIFAITQVPLSILEGVMTVLVIGLLAQSGQSLLLQQSPAAPRRSGVRRPQLILLGVLGLVCLALPILTNFFDIGTGTDDQAGEMIGQIAPHFQEQPFWEGFDPGDGEAYLFALQVAIGIALFVWGLRKYLHSRKQEEA